MSDIDENSSDISEVFSSDSDCLSSNDNEASLLSFKEPEYIEQKLRENVSKCSTEDIPNTKRAEDLKRLENMDWCTSYLCQIIVTRNNMVWKYGP